MEEWRAHLLATTPGLHIIAHHLPAHFKQAQILGGWRFVASRWSRPGVALLGDAAHNVHPMAGQGMNSAIIDAWLLAQYIREEHHGPALTAEAADRATGRYERMRRKQFKDVARLSHIMSGLYTTTLPLVQFLALRTVQINRTNRRLQYIVTNNMSGLGFRPFTWKDYLHLFGLLPDARAMEIGL
jgi:2-polyprenyl-6-methoxyphenol hydroxylase-like FAD-dependent oxidoreductase